MRCRDQGWRALLLSSPAPPLPLPVAGGGPRSGFWTTARGPPRFSTRGSFFLSESLRLKSFLPSCTPPSSRLVAASMAIVLTPAEKDIALKAGDAGLVFLFDKKLVDEETQAKFFHIGVKIGRAHV